MAVDKYTNIDSTNSAKDVLGYEKSVGSGIRYGIGRSNKTEYNKITSASVNELSSSDITAIEKHGLLQKSTIDNGMFTKLSKFGYNDPYNRMPNTREVLFFTKPDLNIMSGTGNASLNGDLSDVEFFNHLMTYYPRVIDSLQVSHDSYPVIPLLHNRVKDTLDLPDLNSQDIDMPANMHGNNYEYRGSSEASDDGFTFTLEFEDTRHLDVYMFFKAYDEYERMKRLGRVSPAQKYIENKVLHDQIAIYKFTLLDDLITIAHYAKLWGCYPTSVPRSVFGNGDFASAGLSLSIQWKSAFVEDMNPLILSEFNSMMNVSDTEVKNKTISSYADSGRINRTWAKRAYVQMEPVTEGSTKYVPRLRWISG